MFKVPSSVSSPVTEAHKSHVQPSQPILSLRAGPISEAILLCPCCTHSPPLAASTFIFQFPLQVPPPWRLPVYNDIFYSLHSCISESCATLNHLLLFHVTACLPVSTAYILVASRESYAQYIFVAFTFPDPYFTHRGRYISNFCHMISRPQSQGLTELIWEVLTWSLSCSHNQMSAGVSVIWILTWAEHPR